MVSAVLLFALAYILCMCYYNHAHIHCAKNIITGDRLRLAPFCLPRPIMTGAIIMLLTRRRAENHNKLLNVLYPAIPSTVSP